MLAISNEKETGVENTLGCELKSKGYGGPFVTKRRVRTEVEEDKEQASLAIWLLSSAPVLRKQPIERFLNKSRYRIFPSYKAAARASRSVPINFNLTSPRAREVKPQPESDLEPAPKLPSASPAGDSFPRNLTPSAESSCSSPTAADNAEEPAGEAVTVISKVSTNQKAGLRVPVQRVAHRFLRRPLHPKNTSTT